LQSCHQGMVPLSGELSPDVFPVDGKNQPHSNLTPWSMDPLLIRILQRNRTSRVWKREKVCHKELAHTIMETDKSQDLQPANWNHGGLMVQIQSQSQLNPQESWCFS
jgi:hypothetical protein